MKQIKNIDEIMKEFGKNAAPKPFVAPTTQTAPPVPVPSVPAKKKQEAKKQEATDLGDVESPDFAKKVDDRNKSQLPNQKKPVLPISTHPQKSSIVKSAPSSGSTDIKSKVIELQQAILEFKNVAQSTDFGKFENDGVRDRETKSPDQESKDSAESYQLSIDEKKLDQYYKGKIQLNGEEAEALEKSVKDRQAKARFNSLDPSLQGHKPAGDILLDQWITPATESVKFWQTHTKDKPDQFLTVDVQHPDRSEKGVGATTPVDFKGLIDTIGRIRYS